MEISEEQNILMEGQSGDESEKDQKYAKQGVAFVVQHSQKGIVSLCTSIASLLKRHDEQQAEIEEMRKNLLSQNSESGAIAGRTDCDENENRESLKSGSSLNNNSHTRYSFEVGNCTNGQNNHSYGCQEFDNSDENLGINTSSSSDELCLSNLSHPKYQSSSSLFESSIFSLSQQSEKQISCSDQNHFSACQDNNSTKELILSNNERNFSTSQEDILRRQYINPNTHKGISNTQHEKLSSQGDISNGHWEIPSLQCSLDRIRDSDSSSSQDSISSSQQKILSAQALDVSHEILKDPHKMLSAQALSAPHEILSAPHEILNVPHEILSAPHEILKDPPKVLSTPHEILSDAHEIPIIQHEILSSTPEIPINPQELSNISLELSSAAHNVSHASLEISSAPHQIVRASHEVPSSPDEISGVPIEVSGALPEISSFPCEISNVEPEISDPQHEISIDKCDISDSQHGVCYTEEEDDCKANCNFTRDPNDKCFDIQDTFSSTHNISNRYHILNDHAFSDTEISNFSEFRLNSSNLEQHNVNDEHVELSEYENYLDNNPQEKNNKLLHKETEMESVESSIGKNDNKRIQRKIIIKGCICDACSGNEGEKSLPLQIGDRVIIRGEISGTVKYFGHLSSIDNTDIHVGLQLDAPIGDNNGTYKEKTYFDCPRRYGHFARLSDIVCLFP